MTTTVDFAGVDDLDLDTEVTGAAAISEAVARRITTRPGDVFYDPTYVSMDLGAWQSRAMTAADLWRLRVDLERCVRAEPRVRSFSADADWYPAGNELRVHIAGVTDEGAFDLVVSVDNEGVRHAIAA